MTQPTLSRTREHLGRVLVPLVTVLWISTAGCDNPACVFSGSCQTGGSGGGGAGSEQASLPDTGQWIQEARPQVEQFRPASGNATTQSVMMIQYSESMAPDTLRRAFVLTDVSLSANVPILDPPPIIGDGRVVIIAPLADLEPDRQYQLDYASDERVTDLTGQRIVRPASGSIGSFRVSSAPPDRPQVLTTFPVDGALNQSETTEIVVMFDRRMAPASFDTSSWAVSVDGFPPNPNPAPVPVALVGSGTAATLTQVWRWRSVDALGQPVPMTVGGRVELALSQGSRRLQDESGNDLEPVTFAFFLSDYAMPLEVSKSELAEPPDAIGRPNLEGSDPVIQVELSQPAQAGDSLGYYLFGDEVTTDVDPTTQPTLIALFREKEITEGTLLVELFPADLDLLDASEMGRLQDGDLALAAYLRRGSIRTPVRLLDSNPLAAGTQDLLFDVTAPQFLGLDGPDPMAATYRSKMPSVTLAGRASEEVRRAEVSTALGDNFLPGDPATVASATREGFFVARPVDLGTLSDSDLPVAFNLRIFDRALNPAPTPISGSFEQVGVVGPEALVLGDPLRVRVLDAATLEPVQGALVATHGGTTGSFTLLDSGTTDASGEALVDSATVGETVLTVDILGYDVFTYHDVRAQRIDVPLRVTGTSLALTAGSVASSAGIGAFTSWIGDSRAPELAGRLFGVSTCTPDAFSGSENCPFGPDAIEPSRLGAQTLFSVDPSVSSISAFNAATFLRAFEFCAPTPRIDPGDTETVVFQIGTLLIDQPSEEGAFATEPFYLSLPLGSDTGDFGPVLGPPTVTLEGLSPGIPGSVPVGLGVAFESASGDAWDTIAAIPGAVREGAGGDEAGRLVRSGTIDPELYVRVEYIDENDNRSGRRPLISQPRGDVDAPDVSPALPILRDPLTSTGGLSWQLEWDDVIEDAYSALGTGLYRATMTDDEGRRWYVWRTDPPDGAGLAVGYVPNLRPLGGTGLADGTIRCEISAFTWESFDPSSLMWVDLERQFDYFSHAAAVTFVQP